MAASNWGKLCSYDKGLVSFLPIIAGANLYDLLWANEGHTVSRTLLQIVSYDSIENDFLRKHLIKFKTLLAYFYFYTYRKLNPSYQEKK